MSGFKSPSPTTSSTPRGTRPSSSAGSPSNHSRPVSRTPTIKANDEDVDVGSAYGSSEAGTNVDTHFGAGGAGGSTYGGSIGGSMLVSTGAAGGLGRLNIVSWRRHMDDAGGGLSGEGSFVGREDEDDDLGGDESRRRRSRPFNAISTVLSHPSRPPAPLRASRKPLPPSAFPSAPGPVVVPKPPPPGFYQPYLDGIQGLWDEWERMQERQRRKLAKGKGKERDELMHDDLNENDDGDQKKEAIVLPDLAGIPDLFFDPGFDLANPLTWERVMAGPNPAAISSTAHGQPSPEVQESLSSNLDDLESHLVHEISLRTPSFFSALSNLQSLNAQTTSCLDRISALRRELAELDEKQAIKGLRVVDRQERLRKCKEMKSAVTEVEGLRAAGRLAKELGEAGDWVGALEGMEAVGRWWRRYSDVDSPSGEKTTPPVLPLATLSSLASIPNDLSILSRQIAIQLEAALSSLVISIIGTSPGSRAGSVAPSRSSSPSRQPHPPNDVGRAEAQYNEARIEFRHQSQPILIGLARCDSRDSALKVWRTCVSRVVKEGMRQHLQIDHEGEEDGHNVDEHKGQSLSDILRDMSHERYLMLSGKMYATMKARIELIKVLGEELSEMMQSVDFLHASSLAAVIPAAASDSLSPVDQSTSEIKEILVSACELANARAAKVLVARTPQHADLSLEEFVAVFEQAWTFVVACEAISGRMIVSLRGVITSQARAFLVKYHSIRLQASAKCVEEEQWVQIDVPPSTQKCVDTIIASAISDMPEHRLSSKMTNGHAEPSANGTGDEAGAKVLRIEDNTFFVVSATAKTVEMLNDYQRLMVNLPLVATDVMNRIIEFLKSFNSRTCQVVLGAGAMRSAGLKNITAKHLALASQSLSIVVSLIPYMREFVRRHLNPKQAVMLIEFDKLKRDFQEHQNEIHAKLVAIMADRLAVHCASLKAIDWEATPARTGPNGYVELLVKETTTLHKVLSKYLSSQAVYLVMSQVVSAVNNRFGDIYGKVELKSEDGKKRMLQDAVFLVNRMKELTDPSVESPILPLQQLVKEKPIPKRHMSATINGLLKRNKPSAENTLTVPQAEAADQSTERGSKADVDADAVDAFGTADTPDATTESKPPLAAGVSNEAAVDSQVTGPAAAEITKGPPAENLNTAEPASSVQVDALDITTVSLPPLPPSEEDLTATDPKADARSAPEGHVNPVREANEKASKSSPRSDEKPDLEEGKIRTETRQDDGAQVSATN